MFWLVFAFAVGFLITENAEPLPPINYAVDCISNQVVSGTKQIAENEAIRVFGRLLPPPIGSLIQTIEFLSSLVGEAKPVFDASKCLDNVEAINQTPIEDIHTYLNTTKNILEDTLSNVPEDDDNEMLPVISGVGRRANCQLIFQVMQQLVTHPCDLVRYDFSKFTNEQCRQLLGVDKCDAVLGYGDIYMVLTGGLAPLVSFRAESNTSMIECETKVLKPGYIYVDYPYCWVSVPFAIIPRNFESFRMKFSRNQGRALEGMFKQNCDDKYDDLFWNYEAIFDDDEKFG